MFGLKKATKQDAGALTEASLRVWLINELARRVHRPPDEIDTTRTFEEYGLDSRVAVQLSGELEKVVERRLSPALLYEHETIDDLSQYLARELACA